MDARIDAPYRQAGTARVVSPQGRIDQSSAEALRLALEPHLVDCLASGEALILDFSGVPYISSVGLRVLMLASRRLGATRIALAALQPAVREVFHISRFDMVFALHDSVDAALAKLSR